MEITKEKLEEIISNTYDRAYRMGWNDAVRKCGKRVKELNKLLDEKLEQL